MKNENSMSKHTPGPWFVNGPWSIQADTQTEIPVIVAQVTKLRSGSAEEREANAELLAAAPELLSALKNARGMLETASRYFPKSIKNGDRFSLLNVLANSVNPAIRKAEGGAA